MSTIVNRVAGLFDRLTKHKTVVEAQKVETFESLVQKILTGEKISEAETIETLDRAGRTVEELRAEVEFHLELARLDEKLSQRAVLMERKQELEEALAEAKAAAEEVWKTQAEIVAQAKANLEHMDKALNDSQLAESERGRLLQARHANRLKAIGDQIKPLELMAARLRARVGHTPLAELEAKVTSARENVERLERVIERHRDVILRRPLNSQEEKQHRYKLNELQEARQQLEAAENRAHGSEATSLRSHEEKIAHLRLEAAELTKRTTADI